MKLIFTALLLAFGVLFSSLELSSPTQNIEPQHPPELPNIRFYEEPNGILKILPPRRFHRLVSNDDYIYGVNISGNILPICDGDGRRILVRLTDNRNIQMTQALAERYGFHHLNWHNYEELFSQYSERNRRRGE